MAVFFRPPCLTRFSPFFVFSHRDNASLANCFFFLFVYLQFLHFLNLLLFSSGFFLRELFIFLFSLFYFPIVTLVCSACFFFFLFFFHIPTSSFQKQPWNFSHPHSRKTEGRNSSRDMYKNTYFPLFAHSLPPFSLSLNL